MTTKHPITPPPDLIEEWRQKYTTSYDLARQAARWGADQELEACSEWLLNSAPWTVDPNERPEWVQTLKRCRRPKPPSLAEQALKILNARFDALPPIDAGTIRRALEQLDD